MLRHTRRPARCGEVGSHHRHSVRRSRLRTGRHRERAGAIHSECFVAILTELGGDQSRMAPASPVQRLFERFTGLERAHGHTRLLGVNGKKKVEPRSVTIHAPVTLALWQGHIDAVYGVGIIPIRDDSTVRWGAIDVGVCAFARTGHGRAARVLARLGNERSVMVRRDHLHSG